jgi:hypothetical protein
MDSDSACLNSTSSKITGTKVLTNGQNTMLLNLASCIDPSHARQHNTRLRVPDGHPGRLDARDDKLGVLEVLHLQILLAAERNVSREIQCRTKTTAALNKAATTKREQMSFY